MLENIIQKLDFGRLSQLLETGGPVVAILLVISVFITATIALKLIQYLWLGVGRKRRTDKAITAWLSGRHEEAYALVDGRRNPVEKTVAHLMRGIMRKSAEDKQVREDIERIALKELSSLRSHFRSIETVVQVAPLLGLFGTVIGMIDAFRTLQNAGAEADPAILAGGIWVALMTTAVGLSVAIPAALVLSWFEGLADAEHNRMRAALTSLLTGRITDGTLLKPEPSSLVEMNKETPGHAA